MALFSTVFCCVFVASVGGATNEKFWKFNASIENPENWESDQSGCEGIVFAPVNTAPVFLGNIETSQIVLPNHGEIQVDSDINFNAESTKCLKLKRFDFNEWFDPRNWKSRSFNSATPHKEKVPCSKDSAIFPHFNETRIYFNRASIIRLKNIVFHNEIFDMDLFFITMMYGEYYADIYRPKRQLSLFQFDPEPCVDPWGCRCHIRDFRCPESMFEEPKNCLNPIQPVDFCAPICAAAVTFKPTQNFLMADLRIKLKEYEADTHVSRVLDDLGNDMIQVIFSEEEFTGKSLEEADDFFEELKITHKGQGKHFEMSKSGSFYQEGKSVTSSLGVVFGTLIAVTLVFGAIFYIHGDSNVDQILTRLRRHRTSSLLMSPFFARFNNTDEDLIIEGESIAGSVSNLTRSFDNPLYGKEGSSGSSTAVSSVSDGSKSQHENPLYDVAEKSGGEEVVEDGKDHEEEAEECLKLKRFDFNVWFDPRSWKSPSFNSATPHKEKVPCSKDSAIFPHFNETRIYFNRVTTIYLKNIVFHNKIFNMMDLFFITMMYDEYFGDIYRPKGLLTFFQFDPEPCVDPWGCRCHIRDFRCPESMFEEPKNCLNPIQPAEFCAPICGAAVTFKPTQNFIIVDLRIKLKAYEADTHVSRVLDDLGNDIIQVIFSEEEFTGKSLEEADDFFEELKITHKGQGKHFEMSKSGSFYQEGKSVTSSLGVVFGTLIAVTLVFAAIFYIHGDSNVEQILTRLRRHRTSSLLMSPFFARFNNTDEDLIIEGESIAGSVSNLTRSFDNPLYGKEGSSGSSTAVSSVSDGSKSQHENPLYDVAEKSGGEEVVEDGKDHEEEAEE